MYLFSTPYFVRRFRSSNLIWEIKTSEDAIYLTFDDGPIPEVTPWVLDILDKYKAKATFFCLGKNIANHPQIFEMIGNAGHSTANHSYNHLNGWKTHTHNYITDVEKCNQLVRSELYRPPYGKIKASQFLRLKNKYKVILWTNVSGDFDIQLSNEKCFENTIKNTRKGSIVVFHDSLKAKEKLQYVLPKFLEYFSEKGFRFLALS